MRRGRIGRNVPLSGNLHRNQGGKGDRGIRSILIEPHAGCGLTAASVWRSQIATRHLRLNSAIIELIIRKSAAR